MKKKLAIITGSSGQDGAYLSDFLLKKNYKVICADRRSSRGNNWRHSFLKIEKKLMYEDFDLTDFESIFRLIKKYKPDEFYNLAAQSFVKASFEVPISTADITAIGVLRILEVLRTISPKTKFYQASSSEMFGKNSKTQNEKSLFYPRSPYAVSKVFAHQITINYREAYKLFACCGILFNHESPLRGEEFVTKKITKHLCEIVKGKRKKMYLGNIYAKRDWGYAKEYVEAMWKMLQQKKPDDYVIGTGNTSTVKDFVDLTCDELNLKTRWVINYSKAKLINLENKKVILESNNTECLRPTEVDFLKANITKAKKILKFKPKINIKKLIKIMVKFDLANLEK